MLLHFESAVHRRRSPRKPFHALRQGGMPFEIECADAAALSGQTGFLIVIAPRISPGR